MASQFDEKLNFNSETNSRLDATRKRAHGFGKLPSPYRVDDVIASLSNAYENRRARQVGEWEKLGRQNAPSSV